MVKQLDRGVTVQEDTKSKGKEEKIFSFDTKSLVEKKKKVGDIESPVIKKKQRQSLTYSIGRYFF